MSRKAIMVDVDGVAITHPHPKGWSANLERDLGVPASALQARFFAVHWNDVVHGRADLRDRLSPVLAEIAPEVAYDSFIDYWFRNDAQINHELIAELKQLRDEGMELHLATVQEHERARYIWKNLDLCSIFDELHYAAALGCSKPAAEFYRAIEADTSLDPSAIFFIDDKATNVEGARACGWTAAQWTGLETVRHLMAAQSWNVG